MDEEVQKRNTDCVYFLASPLTCKKGLDCEYRHNEIARLNPRDCWYWLVGNCLNPTCGFRHPPLDSHVAEAPTESASLPYQSSIPGNKTRIPCYFYFNGFCNKGDRCSYLHGPDGSAPTGKYSKAASAITDTLYSENKSSAGNGTGPPPTGTRPNPFETTSKHAVDIRVQPKDDLLQSSPRRSPQQNASPPISLSEGEEAAVAKADSMVPVEGFMRTKSHVFADWSLEERVDNHFEPEERLESSPGFDVLVDNDNKSENLGYEDDPEYLLSINSEQGDLNGHLLGYDFEDLIEYHSMYPAANPYESETDNAHDYFDNDYIIDNARDHPSRVRERMFDSIFSRKMKPLPMKLAVDNHNVDLRDYLRKRRVVDGRSIIHLSRRRESSRLSGRSRERPQSHVKCLRLHGRLASEHGKNYTESHGDNGTPSNGANWHRGSWHSQSYMFRQRYKEKRLSKRKSFLSVISRKPLSREKKSSQTSVTFSGPKTLAEIKEEKKKVEENGNGFMTMGHSTRILADFQGPKLLSEILEEKKKLSTARDGDISSC